MAVTVGRGLDRFVAEVPLDHRQRDIGLDEPGCIRMTEVMHPGLLGQASLLGPDQSGCPDVGTGSEEEWAYRSGRKAASTLAAACPLRLSRCP